MKKFFISGLFSAFFCFNISSIDAQTKISGRVIDSVSKPLSVANVFLLNNDDSSLVKGNITDTSGSYLFEEVKSGQYLLKSSFTGYKDYFSKSFLVNGSTPVVVYDINLHPKELALAEVKVVARKPLFEQKIDRMVINVRNSITSAGSSALEVLGKSPGVIINRQNSQIQLNGKEGVIIMINGNESKLPLEAILSILSGMSAENIDRIELISTPPANFDAGATAGFINIVLIENPNQGFNGSYSVTAAYGKGWNPATSFNFNYRKNKINLCGDYSFLLDARFQRAYNLRRSTLQGVVTENYTNSNRDPEDWRHNARIGLDIQLTSRSILGLFVAGGKRKWDLVSDTHLEIFKNGVADSVVSIYNHESHNSPNITAGVNFSHIIKQGDLFVAQLEYIYYRDHNPTDYRNTYFDKTGIMIGEEQIKGGKLTPMNILVGKIDYSKKINSKFSLETGIKLTHSVFRNDVYVSTLGQSSWINDPELTGNYHFTEIVPAAYANLNIAANEKTNFKLGVRYEHTLLNLGSDTEHDIIDRKYGSFFPSIFMSRKINENSSFNLSYRRAVSRPGFSELAPFVFFLDPFTYFTGNSALQPAFSSTFKADYLLKDFFFSVSYTKEDDFIARFQSKFDAERNRQLIVSENLESMKLVNLSLTLPFKIASWWTMQNNLQGNWMQINANFEKGPFRMEQFSYTASSSNPRILPKNFSAQLDANYYSKSLFGSTVFGSRNIVTIGVQKKFRDNKSRLKLSVEDIFRGNVWNWRTYIPEENIDVHAIWKLFPRQIKLTFGSSFGNSKLKAKRKLSDASEEEQKRL